jgi:hypothetical protein
VTVVRTGPPGVERGNEENSHDDARWEKAEQEPQEQRTGKEERKEIQTARSRPVRFVQHCITDA